jgi:hypothetical protein
VIADGEVIAQQTMRVAPGNLGFVPMVWVKNLPGGDDVDGRPTFPEEAIDIQIEADYLLSQGGRGLKYQSDPALHIKESQFSPNGGPVVKGAGDALVTGQDGDAQLLEISGDAARTVLDWVKGLRELALEGAGGNRANAEKLSAAQSGRAMELMNQSLIWLADKLRIAYGHLNTFDWRVVMGATGAIAAAAGLLMSRDNLHPSPYAYALRTKYVLPLLLQ